MFLFLLWVFLCLLHLSQETCELIGSEDFDARLCCNESSTELILRPRKDTSFVFISDSSLLLCFNEKNQKIESLHLNATFLFGKETWRILNDSTKSCRLRLHYTEDHSITLLKTATCEVCGIGYIDNGTACINSNNCFQTPYICNATHARCRNTEGNFECTCKEGFFGDGKACEDINECLEEMDDCGANADCRNTEGSYECICRTGFRGNGTDCEDIDECVEDSHECHDVGAECINNNGSYTCTCKNGFTGNGTICEDINECEGIHNACDIHAYCNNTDGSFSCTCLKGFMGNGMNCEAQPQVETEDERTSVIVLGVSTVTAIIFGIFLVVSLCWVSIITLLFIRYLKHGYHNRQVHLGEYNNDKKFDEDFIPVEITCRPTSTDSHLSINTIIYPMEEVDTYTEKEFADPISDTQCDTSNSDNWIMAEARKLGLQQEYLNIVDGHLDVSTPQRWSALSDQSHPDNTFDITSIN